MRCNLSEVRFWSIIGRARKKGGRNLRKHEACLRKELEKLRPQELVEFEHIYTRFIRKGYTWKLWGAAYVLQDGCSDDGFWDFRSWLVAQGEKAYREALTEPETLAALVPRNYPDRHWLNILNPAMFVWGEKLAKDEKGLDDFPKKLGSNLGETPRGRGWDGDDDLKQRYPKLWAKYRS